MTRITRSTISCSIAALLTLVGSIVALGGTAKVNDYCNDKIAAANRYASDYEKISEKACSDQLRFYWWGICFGIVLPVVAFVVVLLGKAGTWSSALQAVCAACVSISMSNASSTYPVQTYNSSNRYSNNDANVILKSAKDAAFTGFIIQSLGLYALIIALSIPIPSKDTNITPNPGNDAQRT
ncbi:hypothetical protein Vretimale_10559 [Volvox reticuliferus]|uniref:Uncharacterized protein n=1 Tax=Volvox reticuliferus TaxID=1737510 RepID=A0A8J4FR40_9CHLO|nr:hypothetical protein Vretifemale_12516 [Volvox reticuliferus]GIM06160.1 hypothetical protein Vretimale_10559 [Volvox reticuliferus]